jgi:hypothetical protein
MRESQIYTPIRRENDDFSSQKWSQAYITYYHYMYSVDNNQTMVCIP